MAFAGWYVVSFKEENAVEVIPSNWLLNFDTCLWPSKFGAFRVSSAIKNGLKPSENWDTCCIKVLSKSVITDFSKATSIANKAQYTSDCDDSSYYTVSQTVQSSKRKKGDKKIMTNLSSDDEYEIPKKNTKIIIPDFPQPTTNKACKYHKISKL